MKLLKQFSSLILAMAAALSLAVPTYARPLEAYSKSLEDSATKVETGKYNGCTLKYREMMGSFDSYKTYNVYSFRVEQPGEVTIWTQTWISPEEVGLYDSNGNSVMIDYVDTVTGVHQFPGNKILGTEDHSYAKLTESEAFGYYEGTFHYTLKKGTYYYYIEDNSRSYDLYDDHTAFYAFQIEVPKKQEKAILDCLQLTMKKGQTMQAGAVLTNELGKVTWNSSKPSVAAVNSKGKITAKAKGTATITAMCGNSKVKLKIRVN